MKKILILGAGIYQLPLIKKAKELGLYTIVTSIPGNYPGFSAADKVYYEDTTNKNAILEIAKTEKIDGILTSGTDVAVSTIGYVCEKLSLSGISEHSANLVTDKALMKDAFLHGNVRTAMYATAHNLTEAQKAAEEIGYPVMFKCANSSGSRGVIKISRQSEINFGYKYASSITTADHIVVEKYIDGYEIGLDGYIDDSQSLFVPHGKIIYYNGKTDVPIGHIFPFDCSENLYEDIITQAKRAVFSLGLNHCFFNMDILIHEDQSYIIEVGGRTGATCIPELIGLHYNIDFYKMMIDAALGNSFSIPKCPQRAAAGRLIFSEKEGILRRLVISPGCHKDAVISFDVTPGESIHKFETGPHRIGQLIVSELNTTSALEKLEDSLKHIVLEVD